MKTSTYLIHLNSFNCSNLFFFIKRLIFSTDKMIEHIYEIDHENALQNGHDGSKNVKFKKNATSKTIDKQGWLQYKFTHPGDIYPNKVLYWLNGSWFYAFYFFYFFFKFRI